MNFEIDPNLLLQLGGKNVVGAVLLMILIGLSITKEIISGLENPTARITDRILLFLIPAVMASLVLVLGSSRILPK